MGLKTHSRAALEPETIVFGPGGTAGEEKGMFRYMMWSYTICIMKIRLIRRIEPVVDTEIEGIFNSCTSSFKKQYGKKSI